MTRSKREKVVKINFKLSRIMGADREREVKELLDFVILFLIFIGTRKVISYYRNSKSSKSKDVQIFNIEEDSKE